MRAEKKSVWSKRKKRKKNSDLAIAGRTFCVSLILVRDFFFRVMKNNDAMFDCCVRNINLNANQLIWHALSDFVCCQYFVPCARSFVCSSSFLRSLLNRTSLFRRLLCYFERFDDCPTPLSTASPFVIQFCFASGCFFSAFLCQPPKHQCKNCKLFNRLFAHGCPNVSTDEYMRGSKQR